jgi:quinol monooxygenase YgiN
VSVFMILRVKGDPDNFERYANANADLMQRISKDGKAAGAVRHAFAGGDGELLVIDEWTDAQAFQRFFDSQTEIPRLMKEGGAQGAPEIAFYRKLDTPDAY